MNDAACYYLQAVALGIFWVVVLNGMIGMLFEDNPPMTLHFKPEAAPKPSEPVSRWWNADSSLRDEWSCPRDSGGADVPPV